MAAALFILVVFSSFLFSPNRFCADAGRDRLGVGR